MVWEVATSFQRRAWRFIIADCKKKVVKQKCKPNNNKKVGQGENPDQYYVYNPSWGFNSCDNEYWSIYNQKDVFWSDVLPKLKAFETQRWQDILVTANKQNHSIDVSTLNKIAVDRLEQLMIEKESLISLRLGGRCRLYGYIVRGVFNMLWLDVEHGDNDTCVCRSKKKHT